MATPDLLSSPERVEHLLKRSGLDDDHLDEALAKASGEFRGATRQHITPVTGDTVTLNGRGSEVILLRELPVTAVTSVTEDGTELVDGTDYEWGDAGILRRLGARWPSTARSVVVVYDHGWDPVPDDIAAAVTERAAANFLSLPSVVNVQLGAMSYGFKPGTTQAWADAVKRYRIHGL